MKYLTFTRVLAFSLSMAVLSCDRIDKALIEAQKSQSQAPSAPAGSPVGEKPAPVPPINEGQHPLPSQDAEGKLPGASDGEPHVCTAMAAAGVLVLVSDKSTGKALDAQVEATSDDGKYTEKIYAIPTLLPVEGNSAPAQYQGLYERPGSFVIKVKKDGYLDFMASNVVIEKDGCHVKMVKVEAKLEKAGGSSPTPQPTASSQQSVVGDLALAEAKKDPLAAGLELKITEMKQVKFSNGCLDAQRPEEMCTKAIVDGWRIVVTGKRPGSQIGIPYSITWIYHSNMDGTHIRLKEKVVAQ